jgi:hypothetical protein
MYQQPMVFDERHQVNRLQPVLPVGGVQTYQILAPRDTHWRTASCAEIGCHAYASGWITPVLAGSRDEAILRQARPNMWTRVERAANGFLNYHFAAGTRCLGAARHRVRIERTELFVRRDGDWRWLGQPTMYKPEDWVDHFANHQDRIATIVNRG